MFLRYSSSWQTSARFIARLGSTLEQNAYLLCVIRCTLRLRALPRALTTQLALTALPRLPRCGLRCAQANQLCPSAQTQAATTSRHKL